MTDRITRRHLNGVMASVTRVSDSYQITTAGPDNAVHAGPIAHKNTLAEAQSVADRLSHDDGSPCEGCQDWSEVPREWT